MEVPRDLYERLVEAAIDLRAQIGYMKDEPRERWHTRWQETCQLVDEAVALRDAAEPDCHSATRLQAFVRQQFSGECRFLSAGADCPCPLCDLSRLVDLAMRAEK